MSSSTPPNPNPNPKSKPPSGLPIRSLPLTHVFTTTLTPDPSFPTAKSSDEAPRAALGPRQVPSAHYTFVKPEPQTDPELLAVSPAALQDLGIAPGEAATELFRAVVAGQELLGWDAERKEGVYPWAQRYGGWQFGSWAGQLGDGRAISLFETRNKDTGVRYEVQLKGAGMTPYSRFADGKAVLRSSLREFVVSEYLNALHIPTTRALSLTLLPNSTVRRESVEPGAIVARFAQSWIRVGTFDLLRSRHERGLILDLVNYVATEVYGGWEKLPARVDPDGDLTQHRDGLAKQTVEGPEGSEQNRVARLYRAICRANAKTVAAWQAYGFMNGVLNSDNTSILGLSLDFGPFAFMDEFIKGHTPNHDDHTGRYSYENQPQVILWNLSRLGEDLGEFIGIGPKLDDESFMKNGIDDDDLGAFVERAQNVISAAGAEYGAVLKAEWERLFSARLGIKPPWTQASTELIVSALDVMEDLKLDFNHFFRRLSTATLAELESDDGRAKFASKLLSTYVQNVVPAQMSALTSWLSNWRARMLEDWGPDADADAARRAAMEAVSPNFVPRSWVLQELIEKTEQDGDREALGRALEMALDPFRESWHGHPDEQRWCGDVPLRAPNMQCSCSS